ncbi:red chlorophyll catabolite reductase [Iris pallida]|uniref:Red chlorophyll catabolite reductase n=1 Tax=Iris pallida TaxID=29817 RepID=A0AAX6HQ87_IRIPA|nr:red chlorophyll catabolite reductase [Iris pallida]
MLLCLHRMITLSHHSSLHHHNLPLQNFFRPPSSSKRSNARAAAAASSSMQSFPHLQPSHRDLMSDLLSAVEARLGPTLLPSSVPPDVLSFTNQQGTSQGALDIRSGAPDSPVDFILQSWLHCKVPIGDLNITTLFAFLNASVDAPHLVLEFIQGSPTSLILLMDLIPRKDLVLHPEYLDEIYDKTHLDKRRQALARLPQVSPYISSSLYIRSVLSPTAISVNIDCGGEGESGIEEIILLHVGPAAKDIVGIWLDLCTSRTRDLGEAERAEMVRRDTLIKNKTVEIDLAANLPRLFGSDVVDRIVREIQKAFRI